jgi:lipoteichoic acid synthase
MQKLLRNIEKFLSRHSLLFSYFLLILGKILIFIYLTHEWPESNILIPFIIYNIAAVGVFFIPALFLHKGRSRYLYFVDVFISLTLIVDTIYFRYYDTLPVINLLGSAGQLSGMIPSVAKLLKFTDLVYLVDIFVLAYFRFGIRGQTRIGKKLSGSEKISTRIALVIIILMSFILTFEIAVDSREKLPKLYNTIGENILVAKNLGVFGAHTMDISRMVMGLFNTITAEEKTAAFQTMSKYTREPAANSVTSLAKGKRIVMLQVESLNEFLVGAKIYDQEITPNINKLASSSSSFTNHIFTLGAGSTSDADFSINTSLYPLLDASVFVKYASSNFTSLEKELANVGYETSAYHANSRGYWNRTTAFKSLGFNNFYAQDNFTTGDKISMGLADKSFLEQSIQILKEKPEKSFNYLITLSSHYAFEMPEKEKKLNLTGAKLTTLDANYLQSIHYTDSAIGEFIDSLKSNNMYDDTLIILYGDHTAKYDPLVLDSGLVDPETEEGKRVPLIIKLPGQSNGKVIDSPSTHLDIMPTILNLVGADPKSPMFGRDLFGSAPASYFTSAFVSNFESIVMDGYKYLVKGSQISCEKLQQGNMITVDKSACDTVLSKRNDIQSASQKLITHNLFDEYLKQK